MSRKLDLVNDAYSQLRISGLTVQPSPSNMQLALYRMEQLMAELFEQRGLNVGYNFQESPALSQQSGVTTGVFQCISTNTAVALCPDFGKEIPNTLLNRAAASLSGAIGVAARNNLRPLQPGYRMPLGNGNTFRWMFWNRFAQPVINAPAGPTTNNMIQGETLDYREDFNAWLGTATIASYEILVDPMLTLVSDSDSDGVIHYRIAAPIQPVVATGPWQLVLISVTDSTGRVDIRLVNFEVLTAVTVGS